MLMKDFFNLRKSKLLLLTLLAAFAGGVSPAWAEEVTVYDGTITNANIPFCGLYVDEKLYHTEYIIPATDLSAISSGSSITKLKLYTNVASHTYGGTFQIYLEETELTALTAYSKTSTTPVYEGGLSSNASSEIEIELTNSYTYNGGNLLVGVYQTAKGTYKSTNFYGKSADTQVTWTGYGTSTGSGSYFAPKTTLTYEAKVDGPGLIVFDGSSKLTTGYSYDFGLAIAGTEKTFTLKNPGTESITVNIAATNGFGVNPGNATIEAKGETTLTVTMADATATGAVTITPTASGVDAFTINVSGTVRDENKVYIDFADGQMPEGWTSASSSTYYSWTVSEGYIGYGGTGSSYSGTLTSPILTFAKDELIAFETARYGSSTWYSPSITVEYSLDGTTWTAIGSAFTDDVYGAWTSRSVTIPVEGVKYIRFNGWYVYLRNIYGGELPTGANFAIDKSNGNFGVAAIGGVAEQLFTITNSGNTALPVTFTDDTDFYVAKTVMFTKPDSWTGDKLYIYAWDGSGALTAAWPGNEVTVAAQNDMSEWVYTASLPKGATGIKFSDNASHETGDISTEDFKAIIGLWLDNSTVKTWKNEDFSVPADGSASFYVRMNTAIAGAKSGSIALAFEALNATEFTLPVSGVVMPADASVVDFNDNQLPAGWGNNASNKWSFADGKASCTSAAELTTPKLQFADGDFFIISATSYDDYDNNYIEITGSVDGSDWTAFTAKKFVSRSQIPYGSYASLVVTDIPTTVKYLKFKGYYVRIDEIVGLKFSADAPVFGYYTDSECTMAATATVKKDFGFVTEAPDAATYYIKNDGTGTMTIALGDVPAGFTAALGKTTLASGESTSLTINMPAETKGYHNGNIVVTAKDSSDEEMGTFTVTASGVMMEEGKLNLNFAAGDVIPTTWTATDWTKNDGGYYRGGYSSTTMETSTLTATAGEEIVIVAKQEYASGSFSVNYKKADAEEWSTLIASTSLGNSGWVTLHASIAEAGDYKFQIVGNYYTQIQRIYGLTAVAVPFMETTAANIAFGMQTAESAEQSFTISNTGEATLTGLSVTLGKTDDAAEYSIRMTDSEDAEFTGAELAVGQTITVYVKQLFDLDNLGSKSDVLTIAADGQTTVTINLTGTTRDGSLLYVDFDEPNAFPEGWQAGANWSVYTYSTDCYAYQSSSSTPSALVTTPLTVEEGQTLSFKVARNNSGYGYTTTLKTRYSQDGGATWSEYAAQYGTDSSNEAGSGYITIELSELPTGNLIFEFYGSNIKLDMIQGVKTATAPALALTEGTAAVANGDTKNFGNLNADGVATYTLKNIGNSTLTSTLTGTGVTVSPASVELEAGETAEITVTMAFGEPYGAKSGSMKIESEGWVGDMTVNYTAEAIDPTDFVVDFAEGQPAGWYKGDWTFSTYYGNAYVYSGVNKSMITEQVEAADGKNVLSFDAKVYYGSDDQTLNVYTSADRKNWSAAQTFTVTSTEQTFSLEALTAGQYYMKFEAANVAIDNVKGVKRILPAPAHDLYEVSTTMAASGTPGASYTATVVGVSLRADETVTAELWLEKEGNGTKVASLENQSMTVNTNKTFTLTGNLPSEEGTYEAWVTVKNTNNSAYFNTDRITFTLEHTTSLAVNTLTAVSSSVLADDNNEFTANLTVTLQNTGSKTLAANEVSVSITDDHTAEANVYTTKTAAQYIYVYPGVYTNSDAVIAVWNWSDATDGEWIATTNMGSGLYVAELKEGKTNFSVVRINPEGTDEDAWNNKWNQSVDLSTSAGNVFTFQSWGEGEGAKDNFTGSAFTLAAGETVSLPVSVTADAGDGGQFSFNAKENVTNTFYHNNYNVNVNVTAAPKLALNETDNTVSFSEGEKYYEVTLTRPFIEGWNTLVLPFDFAAAKFEGATFYEFTANNNGELKFTKVTAETLTAGTPYLVYLTDAIDAQMTFSKVTTGATTATDVEQSNAHFIGNYVNGFDMEGKYGVTPAGQVKKGAAGSTMKAFRAYITLPAGQSARIAIVDETTGISRVLTAKEMEDLNIYNLQGQRVSETAKGVVIVNGKKVVIK